MEHYVGLDVSLKETAICVTGLTLGGSKNQRLRSEEAASLSSALLWKPRGRAGQEVEPCVVSNRCPSILPCEVLR